MTSEEEVERVANDLRAVEEWLAKTGTAGSALGRLVLQDQAALSRWRAVGNTGTSHAKRCALATYILENPDGIPGYTQKRGGRKLGTKNRGRQGNKKFEPNRSPAGSRVGQLNGDGGHSTKLPVPSISSLEKNSDVEWVRNRAFRLGSPIVVVLSEMVSLGIKCQQEIEYEAEQEMLQQQQQQQQQDQQEKDL